MWLITVFQLALAHALLELAAVPCVLIAVFFEPLVSIMRCCVWVFMYKYTKLERSNAFPSSVYSSSSLIRWRSPLLTR